jgi:hypothetical protein
MATLRIRDLQPGKVYREPLSGYLVRVREFTDKTVVGDPVKAQVMYHNPVSGLHVVMEVRDGELEEVTTKKRQQ